MISYINSLEGAEYSRLLKIHNDFKKYNIEELLPDKIDIINELENSIILRLEELPDRIFELYEKRIIRNILDGYFSTVEANHRRHFEYDNIINYISSNEHALTILKNHVYLSPYGYIEIVDNNNYELGNIFMELWDSYHRELLYEKAEEEERNKFIKVTYPVDFKHISYDGVPCVSLCDINDNNSCSCLTDYGKRRCDCSQ